MKHSFTCPNCGTRFKLDVPDEIRMVLCPACGTNIPVVEDEIGSLGQNFKQAAMREGNWILWAAAAFGIIWGAVVLVMVMSSRKAPPAVATGSAPVVTPAPALPPLPPPPAPIVRPPPPPPPPTTTVTPPKPHVALVAVPPKRLALTDADIVNAVHRGTDFLLSNFHNGEVNSESGGSPSHHASLDALVVYSLLHCSQSVHDARLNPSSAEMKLMLDNLKRFPMTATDNEGEPITYGRSLRASALSIYNRTEDRMVLSGDLAWLLHAEEGGAYTYDDVFMRPGQATAKPPPGAPPAPPPPTGIHAPGPFIWDNSNSQYGLIGVWNCAEAGLPVPNKYWLDVERHWVTCQQPSGMWDYWQSGGPGSFSMTMAGITALSVCRDFMARNDAASQPLPRGQRALPIAPALQNGLAWMEAGDHSVSVAGNWYGYSLYGLERAALSSGMMFAGKHDIYRELAAQCVAAQRPNGAWDGDSGERAVIETAFRLLFLSRGRNPVIVNKLRYDGNWNNHPRDAANLARYATYAMERPMNWQLVDLSQPWSNWLEAPILYIAGDVPPALGPADFQRLQSYVENGGMIFIQADNGNAEFNSFAEDLAATLFPKFKLTDVPDDDDLFKVQFNIPQPHPRFRVVSNGSRRLMIQCTGDLAGQWQGHDLKRNEAAFNLGLNLFILATGKSEPRSKTDSPYIVAGETPATMTVPIARIRYGGNWNPEPAAWERFTRYFYWETGWTLAPTETAAGDLKFSDFAIADLTGTTADAPTDAELAALHSFVDDGGTLFIDACGGSPAFNAALLKTWLPALCPGGRAHVIDDDDPILTGKIKEVENVATELPKIMIRPYASQVTRPSNTHLMQVKTGKGRVIYTALDVTTALLGTNPWGITGYMPAYAQPAMKNVILETVSEQNQKQ